MGPAAAVVAGSGSITSRRPLERHGQSLSGVPALIPALRALSRLDQEVLLLVAWDGLDRIQAARVLGITPRLFSVRLHRARRRFERSLALQERASEQQAAEASAMEVPFDER